MKTKEQIETEVRRVLLLGAEESSLPSTVRYLVSSVAEQLFKTQVDTHSALQYIRAASVVHDEVVLDAKFTPLPRVFFRGIECVPASAESFEIKPLGDLQAPVPPRVPPTTLQRPKTPAASALTPRTTPNYPTTQGIVQPGRILPAGVGVYKVLEPIEELKALAEKNGWVYEEQGDELLGKATIRNKRDGKEELSVTWRDSWTRTIGADFNRRTDARSRCRQTLQYPAPEAYKPASRGATQSAQMQCRRSVHHGFHPVDEKCPWCP